MIGLTLEAFWSPLCPQPPQCLEEEAIAEGLEDDWEETLVESWITLENISS